MHAVPAIPVKEFSYQENAVPFAGLFRYTLRKGTYMKQRIAASLFLFLLVCFISTCAKETHRRQDAGQPSGSTAKKIVIKTDAESISAGRMLFVQKCEYCHDAYSTMKLGGPGLKGILKNPLLPVSKKPATPESIAAQLRHPLTNMPSFVYLDHNDVLNIIAFLNTL